MTHSLHRQGACDSLSRDFVVVTMASRGINDSGCRDGLRTFLRLARECGAVNLGDMKQANQFTVSPALLEERVTDASIVQAVFADIKLLEQFLGKLAAANLGLSVTVSGLLKAVEDTAERLGFEAAPHTVAYSLGIWGRQDLLPGKSTIAITTMCGHGLVSAGLVEQVSADLKAGLCTVDEAAVRLARPCVCGIFNPIRAAQLLRDAGTEPPGPDAGTGR